MQISALKYFTVPTMVNKWYNAENQCSYMGRKGNVTCLYLVQLCQALLGQFNVLFLVCTCTLTHIISSTAEPEILLVLCAVHNFSCSCLLYIFNKMRKVTQTEHTFDSWVKKTNLMSLALLFLYLMLNMFQMLIHPSSGACNLFVELFRGLYWSGSMCVGVTL